MHYIKRYYYYVCKNTIGEIGVSIYLIADTYFISVANGSQGIAALNMVLPIYAVIFAIGAMVGRGAAIQFSLFKNDSEKKVTFFPTSILACIFIGSFFSIIGFLFPRELLFAMGANESIINTGLQYTRIFVSFSPFFMLNFVFNAFIRNDGSPSLAMIAVLFSSFLNIIGDYYFMFICGMGMAGAALATSLSPVIGICICCLHFLKKQNTISFSIYSFSFKAFFGSCTLGFSAFISQMENGIITFVYNYVLLNLGGHVAIASYGIIANIALMINSIFTGMSNGFQPLLSEYYSNKDTDIVKKTLNLGIINSLILSLFIFILLCKNSTMITALFNSEGNTTVQEFTEAGIKLYFTGFIFSSINLSGIEFFSSLGAAKPSIIASILRGFVLIIIATIVLSKVFGMIGVWISFPVTEFFTMIYVIINIVLIEKQWS